MSRAIRTLGVPVEDSRFEFLASLLEVTAGETDLAFFRALLPELTSRLEATHGFVTECFGPKVDRARVLAFWDGRDFVDDSIQYDLEGAPCAALMGGQPSYIPKGVREQFPENQILMNLQADSYLGFPLISKSGSVIGHLAFLSPLPIHADDETLSIIRLFLSRAGVELERYWQNETAERLRSLVNSAFAGIAIVQDGIYVEVSDSYARPLGYEAADLLHRPMADFIQPSSLHILADEPGEGHVKPFEVISRRKDGSLFHAEVWNVEVRYRGRLARMDAARDVSDRVALERCVADIDNHVRLAIGRDLHDGLGQQLTGLALAAAALHKRLSREDLPYSGLASELSIGLSDVVDETRQAARVLAPVLDEKHGLAAALNALVRTTSKQSGISCELRGFSKDSEPEPLVAVQLYRIVQEAVNNAVKHSGCRRIEIVYEPGESELMLAIRDDGRGLPAGGEDGAGLGMRSMRYRAKLIQGALKIESPHPEGGATVVCRWPRNAAGNVSGAVSESQDSLAFG